MTETIIKTTKTKRYPREKVFIVTESYAGIKNLSDIFTDLLYSAYQKQESEITENRSGYPPDQVDLAKYGDIA